MWKKNTIFLRDTVGYPDRAGTKCLIIWLAPRAGKMNQIARCDWLPERARWEPSCPLGTTRCIPQAKFHQKPYNKSFIDQVCSVKMAEYWPRSFFPSLLTSTSSRSINTQKNNLANIQPSWPHTWSITHTSCPHGYTGICVQNMLMTLPQLRLSQEILLAYWI